MNASEHPVYGEPRAPDPQPETTGPSADSASVAGLRARGLPSEPEDRENYAYYLITYDRWPREQVAHELQVTEEVLDAMIEVAAARHGPQPKPLPECLRVSECVKQAKVDE